MHLENSRHSKKDAVTRPSQWHRRKKSKKREKSLLKSIRQIHKGKKKEIEKEKETHSKGINRVSSILVERNRSTQYIRIWEMAPLGHIKCLKNYVCSSCTARASSAITLKVTWHLVKTMTARREKTREKG